MKSYKDFEKVYIGSSDIACLTLVGCGKNGVKSQILDFGGDGDYHAYFCTEPCLIGSHYTNVAIFSSWLKIFDDDELTFNERGDFTIYQAGDFGCIIVREN